MSDWLDSLWRLAGYALIPTAEDCSTCGGGGFVGESNYGGMCDECHHGEVLTGWVWRWTAWGRLEQPDAIRSAT